MNHSTNAVNYQKRMEAEIASACTGDVKPTLLLHACCAPCSSAVLERLRDHFRITIFFYNPNIAPEEEFDHRLAELRRLTAEMGLSTVEIVAPSYDGEAFETLASGREDLPEGGARCYDCYRLRQEKTAQYAAAHGFDYMTTTLSVSPHKNAVWLNTIGKELEVLYGVKYLVSDFKKQNGYKRSCDLSAQYGLYRQNYCGCIYSAQEAARRDETRRNAT